MTPGLLALQAALPGDSYLAELLRTLLVLLALCVAAFFGLRFLARRGYGVAGSGKTGAVQVLQRLPLEPRKSLYVVRAGGRVLLIGTGEQGPPALIAELEPGSMDLAREGTEVAVDPRKGQVQR
jgi:flagellar biogenesis protein FliO